MSAEVIQLHGLRGASLAAFDAACAVIVAGMRERDEECMRQARGLLAQAAQVFPVDVEQADALAAMAANKIARVVGGRHDN